MKFQIEMSDNDGGYIQLDIEAPTWDAAVSQAEEQQPGWEATTVNKIEEGVW